MPVKVTVQELTAEAFAPFGQVIFPNPTDVPQGSGEGWKTWISPTEVPADRPVIFGTVLTEYRPVRFDRMERHVDTWELLYPHGGSLIQAVAAPADLDNDDAQPDPDQVQAFLIHPGQAIAMSPGTWHAPAFPVCGTTTYTFAALKRLDGQVPVWIPFPGEGSVEVAVGGQS